MAFTRSNTAEQLPVATEETQFQNQDPVTIPASETVQEPVAESGRKGKKGRILKDQSAEPEVKVEEQAAVINEPVATEPTVENVEPAATAEVTEVVETKAEQTELEKFRAMSTEQVWNYFGGYDKRGVISQAIRHLNAVGMSNSEVAKKLDKRYQHVRNVLNEPVSKK